MRQVGRKNKLTSEDKDIVHLWGLKKIIMKKFRLTLLLGMLSISCFGQSPIESPCNDSWYVSLKTKAIGQIIVRF
jgi:hypothetical protein